MLTAQLTGLLQKLAQQDERFEEIARFLAQAAFSEGVIYLAPFGEMKAVAAAAFEETEIPSFAREWKPESYVTHADRVFILAKKDEGDELAGRLSDASIPFALLSSETKESDLPDVFLSLGIDQANELAEIGGPNAAIHAIAALYAYQSIKMKIDEMLAE